MSEAHDGLWVVLGAGATGVSVTRRLHVAGRRVRVVTRSGRASAPDGVEVVAADMMDPKAAAGACRGASVVLACVGFPSYVGWSEKWPPMMTGMLAGAEAADARFVFMDNLYMYGPVNGPLREDLPLTDYGVKPALRARITRMWQEAHAAGRVRTAAVRASDFYGPGVRLAILGDYVTGPAVRGKTANVIGDPDMPHTVTYIEDVTRALITVAEAEDDAYGQAWHVPSAPARPLREVVGMIYKEAGNPVKLRAAPGWLISLMGLFNGDMREMKELMHHWNRPYIVDHSKFASRFWDDYTPLETGIPAAVRWYREQDPAD
jgi:nucleoside-diphosphate-sugar epimerase